MKLLLLGRNGQVGWELQRSLAPLGELVALDFDSTDFHADFSRPEELADTIPADVDGPVAQQRVLVPRSRRRVERGPVHRIGKE